MVEEMIQLPPDIAAELPSAEPEHDNFFLRIADRVSDGMGSPTNILIWLVAVVAWTLTFALSKHLAKGTFLPPWFTSQGYNFPLNLITTVAELFIGFLVAAATNRVERANDRVMARMEAMEKMLLVEVGKNTSLTQEVKTQTDLLEEIHRHVALLAQHAGPLTSGPPPPSDAVS